MDFVTLLSCCAVAEGCLAVALLSSGSRLDRTGWHTWAVSLAMRSGAFILYVLPIFVSGWHYGTQTQFLAVMLILFSSAVSMFGTAEFLKIPAPEWRDVLPLVLVILAYVLAFHGFESPRWRIAMVSTGLAYGLAWSGWKIARSPIGSRRDRWFVVIALGLWVLILLARVSNVMVLPADASDTAVSVASLQPWFFVGYLIAVIDTVVGLIGLRDGELLGHLEDARAEAVRRANTDTLTGLMSRPAVLEQAHELFNRLPEPKAGLAVLMIDCDHFKSINDRFGHFVGDMALKQLGQALRDALPPGALAGRFGGEEFLVLLPPPLASSAMPVAEAVGQAVRNIALESGRRAVTLSVSLGVAVLGASDQSLQDLMNRADSALLQAKSGGRDRVVFAVPMQDLPSGLTGPKPA